MALTIAQIHQIRREVGSTPDDVTLNLNFDRLLVTGAVVLEILETRLADLISSPSTFTVIGEYSQSVDANIIALREQLKRLRGEIEDTTGLANSGFHLAYAVFRPR